MTPHNWERIVNEWERTEGMSLSAFARKKGVQVSTLDYQIKKRKFGPSPYKNKRTKIQHSKKANGHANGNGFIDLTARPMFENVNGHLVINVPAGTTAEKIVQVVKILEGKA